MLHLEIEEGYRNKAVIGGLDRVLSWWPAQIQQTCRLPAQESAIQSVIALIRSYRSLPDVAARAQAIADIQAYLRQILTVSASTPAAPDSAASEEQGESAVNDEFIGQSVGQAEPADLYSAGLEMDVPASEPKWTPRDAHLGLQSPVTAIVGIGPTLAGRLKRLGVQTIYDLLYFFPYRYEDYTQLKPIARLQYGEQVTVIGTIRDAKVKQHRGGTPILNVIVADGTGEFQATWFNQPYLARRFKPGMIVSLSGQVDEFLGRWVMTSPMWEILETTRMTAGRLVPIYALTKGLSAAWLRKMIEQALSYWVSRLPEYLPTDIRDRLGLMSLERAMTQIHRPDDTTSLAAAQRRLAFDEFLLLQLGVLRQRRQWQSEPGIPVPTDQARLEEFMAGLPYTLTDAQQRALSEIAQDMAQDRPMSRLLQGDVGSGKTIVAAAAMFLAAAAGMQSAIMAPTEILAEQHFKSLERLLSAQNIRVRLLTGSMSQADKDAVYAEIASGEAQVVVGTHAIIQEGVQFQSLVLAIIDEQHRFGVRQRGILRGKGYNPHILVMSATPIPRTLALTAYGDLDLSILDEMPPGRQPIQTKWFAQAERERAYRFVRMQVQQGRQAFIICPLVQESDKIEAKAAVEEHQRLQKTIFPDLRLGLLHGRMKSDEKEQVMRQFSQRELDILVSTSVVEVGIDVPNATVMLIEGANRFGLSQLHQFRGRVGRGEHPSYCILMADSVNDLSQERLRAIEETQDGFILAQKDMEMRGPGDLMGTRQSGMPELKLASLGDTPLLELARREALDLYAQDPDLARPEHQLLAAQVSRFWRGEGDLS